MNAGRIIVAVAGGVLPTARTALGLQVMQVQGHMRGRVHQAKRELPASARPHRETIVTAATLLTRKHANHLCPPTLNFSEHARRGTLSMLLTVHVCRWLSRSGMVVDAESNMMLHPARPKCNGVSRRPSERPKAHAAMAGVRLRQAPSPKVPRNSSPYWLLDTQTLSGTRREAPLHTQNPHADDAPRIVMSATVAVRSNWGYSDKVELPAGATIRDLKREVQVSLWQHAPRARATA